MTHTHCSGRLLRFVSITALLLLSSCSTAHKRAEKFMENGLYSDAVAQYEAILAKDPGDEDAVVGLRRAREGVLDRKLIDVRLARLAGSPAQSLELLLEVVQHERKWAIPPAGRIAFTQEEETYLSLGYFRQTIEQDLKASKPLRAEFFLRKFQPVFEGTHQAPLQGFQAAILQKGQDACASLRKEKAEGKPHFARLTALFCSHWGTETDEAPDPARAGDVTYFPGVQLAGSGVEGLSSERQALLLDALQKAFARTAWFDPRAKGPLGVSVSGRYAESRTRDPIALTHGYQVKVPYTEYVQVQKERQVPIEGTQQTRKEQYTVNEPRTRYRDEDRFFHYRGWMHRQSLSLELGGRFTLGERPLEIAQSDSSRSEGIEHHENQPAIGLSPKRPTLEDPALWLKTQSQNLGAAFEARLIQAWKDLYCKAPLGGGGPAALGNHIQRCLRQALPEAPDFAETWYQSTFGLSVKDATTLLGK